MPLISVCLLLLTEQLSTKVGTCHVIIYGLLFYCYCYRLILTVAAVVNSELLTVDPIF